MKQLVNETRHFLSDQYKFVKHRSLNSQWTALWNFPRHQCHKIYFRSRPKMYAMHNV